MKKTNILIKYHNHDFFLVASLGITAHMVGSTSRYYMIFAIDFFQEGPSQFL
jgi:hypothetical protein